MRYAEVRERIRQLKAARATADDHNGVFAGREGLLG